MLSTIVNLKSKSATKSVKCLIFFNYYYPPYMLENKICENNNFVLFYFSIILFVHSVYYPTPNH